MLCKSKYSVNDNLLVLSTWRQLLWLTAKFSKYSFNSVNKSKLKNNIKHAIFVLLWKYRSHEGWSLHERKKTNWNEETTAERRLLKEIDGQERADWTCSMERKCYDTHTIINETNRSVLSRLIQHQINSSCVFLLKIFIQRLHSMN
mgnify:CR=1 FL=1